MALVYWPAHSCPGKAHSHPYKKGTITEPNLYSLALNSAPSEVGRGSLCLMEVVTTLFYFLKSRAKDVYLLTFWFQLAEVKMPYLQGCKYHYKSFSYCSSRFVSIYVA